MEEPESERSKQEELRAAREREHWLRSRLDREREENLLILRYLAFQREASWMRFWRWLIDDTRSQRREERALFADYPGGVPGAIEPGWADRAAMRIRNWWRRRN